MDETNHKTFVKFTCLRFWEIINMTLLQSTFQFENLLTMFFDFEQLRKLLFASKLPCSNTRRQFVQ